MNRTTIKPIPRGAYELMSGKLDQPLPNQSALDNPNIDGIRLKARWSDVETAPGVYNWANIDAAVAQVAAKGKQCGISVNAGSDCPYGWLTPLGMQTYVLLDTGNNAAGEMIPVPGDPIFENRFFKLINHFGAKYNNNPTVSYVMITGPGNHDEWNLAGGTQDTANLGNTQAQVDLWKTQTQAFISRFAAAFSKTTIVAALAKPFNNNMGVQAMIECVNYGIIYYGHQFGLAFNGLNANSNIAYEPANQIALHWTTQPTWAQFGLLGGGTQGVPQGEGIDQALRAAVSLNIRGVEIYKPDAENSAIYDYTAPPDAMFRGVSIADTPAGIVPRRAEMLAIPLPV